MNEVNLEEASIDAVSEGKLCLSLESSETARGKGERRAREAREDWTREDRGRGPSPSRAHFDFLPSHCTTCHAG